MSEIVASLRPLQTLLCAGCKPLDTRGRGPEATTLIEVRQLRLVVHVQPLYTTASGNLRRALHQRTTDALQAPVRVNSRVEDEGVALSIPGEVHEPDKVLGRERADVGKAVLQDGLVRTIDMIWPGGPKELI